MFFKKRKELKELIRLADWGDAEAMFNLGKRYLSGKGVDKDFPRAKELLEEAAKKGYTPAYIEIGELYYNGIMDIFGNGNGIERDYAKAAYWLEKAAESGAEITDDLCLQLGEVYRWGEYGIEADPAKSAVWYLKLAEKGDLSAMGKLASCYFILEDKENALLWEGRAAEGGDPDEMCSLGAMYHDYGDLENALIWYNKAAEKNDSFALCAIGEMYLNGEGVEKDLTKAEEYLRKSAKLGYEDAEKLLKENF